MAIDPATAKAIAMVAKQALEDEKLRRTILIVLTIPILVVLLVIASPFAILFGVAGETADDKGTTIKEIMQELNLGLNEKINEHSQGEYDEVNIIYLGSEGETINNGGTVLALFAVDNSMIDDEAIEPMPVANLNNRQVRKLEDLYWEMNSVSSEVKSLNYGDEDYPIDLIVESEPVPTLAVGSEPEPTPTPAPYIIKNVYITCLDYEAKIDDFNFNDKQLKVLEEMMNGEFAYIFASINGGTAELTPQEIAQIRANLPADLSVQREQIVFTAYSLVGDVNYFWGGKSTSIGWDSRWGVPTRVTSRGTRSYGQTRPFGLDCSGYVKWVFLNSGFPLSVINDSFGTGSSHQWTYSTSISKSSVQAGDLAFKAVPGSGINHVGIVVGKDSSGTIIVAHCASSPNNVVVTPYSPTFRYFRRPIILD